MAEIHPYKCSCDKHTRQRNYARELRERKAKGEVEYRPRPRSSTPSIKSGPRERTPGSRLVESNNGAGTIGHWMPPEGEAHTCPECGAAFMKIDGEWMAMSVV